MKQVENNLIMIFLLLAGEKKQKIILQQNIGLSEILGVVIGVKKETLDSLEVKTILVLNQHAHGLHQLIPGPMMSEIKQNQKLKMLCLNNF